MKNPLPVTRSELAECNGRNGKSAWVAVDGIVYDVTKLFLWKKGRHWAMHDAGGDLTEDLQSAPHGADLLKRAEIVGRLVD